MARKRHSAEEIIGKLREVEVLLAKGRSVVDAAKAIGVTEQSCYRWPSGSAPLRLPTSVAEDDARQQRSTRTTNAGQVNGERIRKSSNDFKMKDITEQRF